MSGHMTICQTKSKRKISANEAIFAEREGKVRGIKKRIREKDGDISVEG